MLSARQPPLGLSVTSWPLSSLNFTLSQFANSLFGDTRDIFCKKLILVWLKYFRYPEKKNIKKYVFGERSIWRHLRYIYKHLIGDILTYLRYIEMSHFCDVVFGIYFVFVGVFWKVICWCHHLKDIFHAFFKDI